MPHLLIGMGGFLVAVLWVDLMFDVQVMNHDGVLPEQVLASLAGYYHRVTTAADPMGNVVSLVMMLTVVGSVMQLGRGAVALWLRVSVLVLAVAPAVYALVIVVPAAVRLGAGGDPPELQTELARTILAGHAFCLACVLGFVTLQLLVVRRLRRGEPSLVP